MNDPDTAVSRFAESASPTNRPSGANSLATDTAALGRALQALEGIILG